MSDTRGHKDAVADDRRSRYGSPTLIILQTLVLLVCILCFMVEELQLADHQRGVAVEHELQQRFLVILVECGLLGERVTQHSGPRRK
jgi:hypothetical protein